MRIGMVVHSNRDEALRCAARAVEYLREHGCTVYAEDRAAQWLAEVTPFSEVGDEPPQVILCLGGDGTILRGGQYSLRWDAPLLGVNLGRVGFLAETEIDGLSEALRAILSGAYTLDKRPLLAVEANGERWLALNDAVITRGGYARLIGVTAMVNGEPAGHYVADGLIVATPTGSTGYSLSAGGPVVSPQVDCMVITPICAHSLQHRPTVVPGSAEIRLLMGSDAEQSVMLEVDGQTKACLSPGAQISVRRAEETLSLIRLQEGRFFSLLREKLTEWSR